MHKNNSNNKKCSFVRGRALSGMVLALLIAIFLSGCSGNNPIYENEPSAALNCSGSSSKREADLLTLVNPWNSLDKNYYPILACYTEKHQLDRRAINDFVALIEECRSAGNEPYVCSAYRSCEKQHELFEIKVFHLKEAGMDDSLARTVAAREIAPPGTSEHQLGLAVDIIDVNYVNLDEAQADTPTQRWLAENSWRYGFILRYPEDKSEITGIIFEPWHYRYVGKNAAKSIYESGLCLEEWLAEREKIKLEIQSLRQQRDTDKWEIIPAIA